MFMRIECRNCGRRLKVPYGANPRKARCPVCGTKVDPGDEEADQKPPSPSRAGEPAGTLPVTAPEAEQPLPVKNDPIEILSLDDDGAAGSTRKDGDAAKSQPPPYQGAFPPLRFRAVLRSARRDGSGAGPVDVVATPHGLFIETSDNVRTYVPISSKCEITGPGELTVTAARRVVELRLVGVGQPDRLARDLVSLLAGANEPIDPADYRRPGWLYALAGMSAAALAVGPVVLARSTNRTLAGGLAAGGGFAAVGLAVNLLIVFRSRAALGWRTGLMAGAAAALTLVFAVGAFVFLRTNPAAGGGEDKPAPFVEFPALPPQPPPPTYLDAARADGMAKMVDGPADVSALALVPGRPTLLAAYEDGSTRIWPLDRPTFDGWQIGPKCDGPCRQLTFTGAGGTAVLSCPGGSLAVPLDAPPINPLKIPGDFVSVQGSAGKEKDRFAALRAGKMAVRFLPPNLVSHPVGTPVKGVVRLGPKQEAVDPLYKNDLPAPAKLTFLTWHPSGVLLGGLPDGSVIVWSAAEKTFHTENPTHKAPVRVVSHGAMRPTWRWATSKAS